MSDIPPDVDTGYHGDALDLYVKATSNVVRFRRRGARIHLAITGALVADLSADEAEKIARDLYAASRLARADTGNKEEWIA